MHWRFDTVVSFAFHFRLFKHCVRNLNCVTLFSSTKTYKKAFPSQKDGKAVVPPSLVLINYAPA